MRLQTPANSQFEIPTLMKISPYLYDPSLSNPQLSPYPRLSKPAYQQHCCF